MKRSIFLICIFLFAAFTVIAQPVPPSTADNGGTNGQVGGNGAPIGGGLALMLGLFAAYGTKKAWNARHKLDE